VDLFSLGRNEDGYEDHHAEGDETDERKAV
jgi:hypothetical protein